MLRRWVRGLLVTVIAGFVATGAVSHATAPLIEIVTPASISADLGAVRVELKF